MLSSQMLQPTHRPHPLNLRTPLHAEAFGGWKGRSEVPSLVQMYEADRHGTGTGPARDEVLGDDRDDAHAFS